MEGFLKTGVWIKRSDNYDSLRNHSGINAGIVAEGG